MKAAACLAALAAVMCLCPRLAANDLRPVLQELGDVDRNRPAPPLSVAQVLDEEAGRANSTPADPVRIYHVDVALEGFSGKIRLGEYRVEGPDREGRTWPSGVDQGSVQAAWLKSARDLALVAWRKTPDGRGTGLTYYCGSAVVRLAEGRASVLLRATAAMNCRPQDYVYDGGLHQPPLLVRRQDGHAYREDQPLHRTLERPARRAPRGRGLLARRGLPGGYQRDDHP